MTQILRAEDLGVVFGEHRIFSSLSLRLEKGVYALRGANGIGKSTLLRLLGGAQAPTTGQIWIEGEHLGRAPVEARQRLSYVPDASQVYPFMTGRDLFDFVARAKKTTIDPFVSSMILDFKLRSHLTTRFDALSLGTQKKIMICAAFLGAPRFLLMDEPSNGVDTDSLGYLEMAIKLWGKENLVLLATHDVDFVTAVDASIIDMEALTHSD